MLTISASVEEWPIDGNFNISRSSKNKAEVIVCTIEAETADGMAVYGRGECVPYGRYGETTKSVLAQVDSFASNLPPNYSRNTLLEIMPAGAARNALDCAMWDVEAKQKGVSVAVQLLNTKPKPLMTAYTLSLESAEKMYRSAKTNAHRPLLKIKVGNDDADACITAVRKGAPNSRIIVDANEAWTEQTLDAHMAHCQHENIALVEQPLPADNDEFLREASHHVPICADESAHTSAELDGLVGKYDVVNIKLDKTGGLSEAFIMKQRAEKLGFGIMVGCMVATSLAMAPAVLLAQGVEYVDLDGPLLLARDRSPGLRYDSGMVYPPEPDLWG